MKYRSRRETIRLLRRLSIGYYELEPCRTRSEWLAKRRCHVGASDAAAVLGKSPWKTARDVYFDKTNLDNSAEKIDDSMMKGMVSESRIRELFSIETGKDVVDGTGMLMVSNHIPCMSCTLDGIVLDNNGRNPCILEIKSVTTMSGWEGDTIPEHYLIQILHQMFVTGYRKAILLARFRCSEDMAWPGREKIYTVDRNDYEDVIKSIRDKIDYFWRMNVCSRRVPNAVLPEV